MSHWWSRELARYVSRTTGQLTRLPSLSSLLSAANRWSGGMAGLADAGQDVVGGAAQPDADPGGRPSTDVELDSFGLVVGRQTLVADSNTASARRSA